MATIILNPTFILNFSVGVEYLDNFDDFFCVFCRLEITKFLFCNK